MDEQKHDYCPIARDHCSVHMQNQCVFYENGCKVVSLVDSLRDFAKPVQIVHSITPDVKPAIENTGGQAETPESEKEQKHDGRRKSRSSSY